MTVYIASFLLTTMLVQAAGIARHGTVRVALCVPAVLVMSTVAGARDYHVGGPDTLAYGNPIFMSAVRASRYDQLVEAVRSVYAGNEHAYLFLNFMVSRFTSDPHGFYFVLSALVSTVVLTAIMLLRHYGATGLMWLTYLCTAYVDSFNLLRQTPALALALLGVAATLRRHRWIGLAIGLSGVLFHTSAMVFLPVWLVTVYLTQARRRPGRRAILVILAAAALSLAGAPAIQLLASVSGDRFAGYLTQDAAGGAAFALDTLYRLVPIVVGVVAYRAFVRAEEPPATPAPHLLTVRRHGGSTLTRTHASPMSALAATITQRPVLLVMVALLAIELLLIPLREISYPLYRIPLYFGYVKIVAYAIIARSVAAHRAVASTGLIVFVCAYFLLVVVGRLPGEYSSEMLGVVAR